MKELITWMIISGLTFLLFLVTLILGLIKKSKKLKLTSLTVLVVFIGLTSWTAFKVVSKTYNKVTEALKPRTGYEIYDALFDKRKTDCITVLHYQDQVIPKIDIAIWLHFETCPSELKRILSKHEFLAKKSLTDNRNEELIYGTASEWTWFKPTFLGDTMMVYNYSSPDNRNIQTIWTNLDSTQVFVRDIFD